jgi:(p)ppGpp synthase/HD superfamily hydrolase
MDHNFSKRYIALKFELKGLGFFNAMKALELGKDIHNHYKKENKKSVKLPDGEIKTRKDGITPDFQHQIEIALYILTLKDIKPEILETVLICALLHDLLEDHPTVISEKKLEDMFGSTVLKTLHTLNKNNFSDYPSYFKAISEDLIAGIVKLSDRKHNMQSMQSGNFTISKQDEYTDEVVSYFLPTAKTLRKNFPEYTSTFYNIEYFLKAQVQLVRYFTSVSKELESLKKSQIKP